MIDLIRIILIRDGVNLIKDRAAADQPVGRKYDSSGRLARAAQSRRLVITAAHELFVRNGYGPTSVGQIAQAAGVSVPTVYAGFASKAEILKVAIDVAVVGDDEPVPLDERPQTDYVFAAATGEELLARYAMLMGELAKRAAPISHVLLLASDTEPGLAALQADLERQRLVGASRVAAALQLRDALPAGRTVQEARDLVWLYIDPEIYVNLCIKRRWSTRRYVDWARNTLVGSVLGLTPAAGSGS
jgi:AcrR family transcriptional regulator